MRVLVSRHWSKKSGRASWLSLALCFAARLTRGRVSSVSLISFLIHYLEFARGVRPAMAGAAALLSVSFPLSITYAGEYLIYDSIAVTGSNYNLAFKLTSDHLQNIYFLTADASSCWGRTIKKLTPENSLQTIGAGFGRWSLMAVDPNLWIWVLDTESDYCGSDYRRIKKVDAQGNVALTFGNPSTLSLATAIASDGTKVWVSHNALWVCPGGMPPCGWGGYGKLETYSTTGSLQSSLSAPWRYANQAVYQGGKIFVNGATDLYCGTQRVWLLDAATGNTLISFPRNSGLDTCNTSDGFIVAPDGHIYIKGSWVEGYGWRKYDQSGDVLGFFQTPGATSMAVIDSRRFVFAADADGNGNTAGDVLKRLAYNNTPEPPAGLSPTGSTPLHSQEVVFSWNASGDADGDSLTYEIYISQTNGNPTSLSLAATTSNTQAVLTLTPGTYYWMVRAKDAYRHADSVTQQMSYSFVNSAPTVPSYSNQLFTTRDTTVDINWQPSSDVDGDLITYRFYLGATPGSLAEVYSGNQTSFAFSSFSWGQTYYFRVSAEDQFGTKAEGSVATIQVNFQNVAPTAPGYPNSLNYTTRDSSIVLNWNPSSDADGDSLTYKLFLGNSPSSLSQVYQGAGTSYSFSGFSWGATYYWKVSVEDSHGGASEGSVASVAVNFQNAAPTAPILNGPFSRGIHSSAPFSDAISWLLSSDADGDSITYKVFRGPNPSSLSLIAEGLAENSFTLNNLEQGSTSYVMIRAIDQYGAQTDGIPTAISYYLANQPPEPIIYTSTWGAIFTRSTSAFLSWQIPSDPEGDPVTIQFWAGTDPGALNLIAQGSRGDYLLTGLSFNATYYWKVDAMDSFGAVRQGEAKSLALHFKNSPPPLPSALSGSGVLWRHKAEPFGETVSWSDVADQDGDPVIFSVYFGSSTLSKVFEGSGISSYFFDGLRYGTTYYWQVIARDPFSVSTGLLNQLQVFLQNSPPSIPTISQGTGVKSTRSTSELLSWNAPLDPEADQIAYTLYAGTEAGNLGTVAQNLGLTQFVLNDLAFGVTYYWRIGARDSFGAWVYSSISSLLHNFHNTAPQSPVVSGEPVRHRHLQEPFSDVLSFTAGQDAEEDAVSYLVYLGTYPASLGLLQKTTATAVTLSSLAFKTTYYALVIASDTYGALSQSGLFSWSYVQINNPPLAPVVLSTGGPVLTRSPSYNVAWQNSIDPEGDVLTYTLSAGTDTSRFSPVAQGEILTGTLNDLVFGTTYFFRVSARDPFGAETFGSTKSVVMVFKNQAPSPVQIASSTGVIKTRQVDYVLEWNPAQDADNDAVAYKILWGINPESLISVQTSETRFSPAGALQFGSTYYFLIEASDTFGGVSSSPLVSIRLEFLNNAPGPESSGILDPPVSGHIVTSKNNITLTWPAYSDPDGDPITYTLQLGNGAASFLAADPNNLTLLQTVYEGPVNSQTLSNLQFNTPYAYRIIVRDSQGASVIGPSSVFTLVPQSSQSEPYNYPNPFRVNEGTNFVVTALESVERVKVSVYSIYQDLVWEKDFGSLSIGVHRLHWDGNDAYGRPVFSGLYVAMVETPAGRKTTRMVAIR